MNQEEMKQLKELLTKAKAATRFDAADCVQFSVIEHEGLLAFDVNLYFNVNAYLEEKIVSPEGKILEEKLGQSVYTQS